METSMDKKSKIFFLVFFLLIAVVVVITYMKYFVAKDYYITAQADCDPTIENCFVYTCDPEIDSECPEDPAEQASYYKLVNKKANQIPLCDPNEEDCNALDCDPGMDCQVIYCDESNVSEEETCNDPERYLEENPPASEEEEACDPDDEECLEDQEEADTACAEGDEECSESEEQTDAICLPDDSSCSEDESTSDDTDAAKDTASSISKGPVFKNLGVLN